MWRYSWNRGDIKNSHNISPAALLAAATNKIKIMKHGNVASTSKSGSADLLEEMGVNLNILNQKKIFELSGFLFIFAKKIHPVMAKFKDIRKKYKKKCLFNFLGPLCNPYKPKYNVFGVSDIKLGPIYAEIAKKQMSYAAIKTHV